MRFRCVSCEIEFEAPAEGRIRCPQCLRQHGLEELVESSPRRALRRPSSRSLLTGLALASLAGLVAAGGVMLWKRRTDLPRPGQLAILDRGVLRRTLIQRGVPEAQAGSPFSSGPALRAVAAEARGSNPGERARSLARAIAKRVSGLEPDLAGTGGDPIRDAEELARELANRGSAPGKTRPQPPRAVTSCELAVLTVAALREAGLAAVLGVARQLEAPTRTPDVAGGIARYLAIVYPSESALGQRPVLSLDPLRALALPGWAGGGGDPEMTARVEGVTPLDDGSAAAHLLALRGFRLARGAGAKPEEAYALTAVALKAGAPSAILHLLRAAVLAMAGGVEDALAEAKQAVALEDGAAARTAVARLQASTGRAEAVQSLEQAVRADGGYWPARLALAALYLPVDPKRGEAELEAARKVAPEEPALLLLEAMRALSAGGPGAARAVALLRRALALRPSPQAELLLYQALVMNGEAEAARAQRQRLLKAASAEERARLEQALAAIDQLATSASRPTEGETGEESAPPPRGPPPRLTLPDVKLSP